MSRVKKICTQCGWCIADFQDRENQINMCKVCGNCLNEIDWFFGKKLMYKTGDNSAKLIEKKFNIIISKEMHQKRRDYYKAILEQRQLEHEQQQKASADASYKAFLDKQNNAPKCPTCGSTSISNIGTIERGVSVGMVGLASGKIGKTRKCNSCGYMW